MKTKHFYVSNRANLMCGKPAHRRVWTNHEEHVTCEECKAALSVAKSHAATALRRTALKWKRDGGCLDLADHGRRELFLGEMLEEMSRG